MVRVHRDAHLAERLLGAAQFLLDSEGIEGVTIRACARRAEVSHAAPAKHFPDRRSLLTRLAERCMADLAEDVANRLGENHASPHAGLGAIADATVGYALVHPQRYRLMWRTDLLDSQDPALQRQTNRLFGQIEALVSSIEPPPGTTRETLVIAICSAIHGYVSMRIDRNFRPASDESMPRPRHFALIDLLLGPAEG
jgi:AcrR family transcriptional regulator